jgi:hypothetical protein
MLKPKDVANELRRIAATIDASAKPQRELVAADIKKVINKLNGTAPAPQK